jgi:hypothetical protein
MANEIKLKRGSGSDPGASDLSVGEVAIRTDNGKLFTKKDNGTVTEITGGGGIDDGDKGDITVSNSGATFTIDNQVVTTAKLANDAVTQNKIADDSVGTAQLVNGGVSSVKIGSDAITGAKIADDSIDSEHYVDGSIDTAHIADDQVTYAKIQNVSATDRILGRDSSGAGVIEEITPANLRTMINVEDGATADQSASEIVALIADQTIAPSTIDMEDDERIKLGASDDLLIYHDTNSFVRDVGGGDLFVDTNGTKISLIADGTSSKTMANFNKEGAVELYHNTNKKFETSSSGIHVTGDVSITGDYLADDDEKLKMGDGFDLQIYHDGSNSYVQDTGTGNLKLLGSTVQIGKSDNSEIGLTFTSDGSIQLRHDNSTKFETSSSGVSITGNITATGTIGSNNITITDGGPKISFVDTNNNDDFDIKVNSGSFKIVDATDDNDRFAIDSSGNITATGTFTTGSHVITGNITVSGTVDGRDVASDGSKLDGIASGATNVTNTNQLTNGAGFITDVVNDTSPQLGGDLASNGNNIRFGDSSDGSSDDVLSFGAGNDLLIYHYSDSSYIQDNGTGPLQIYTNGTDIRFKTSDGETMTKMVKDGGVELYHNASLKCQTTSSGINVAGSIAVSGNVDGRDIAADGSKLDGIAAGATVGLPTSGGELSGDLITHEVRPDGNNTRSLGTSSKRWSNVFTNDLHLSNKGGSNKVDNTWGDFTIQEGMEDLFLINNRNGKMFKFVLQEVN